MQRIFCREHTVSVHWGHISLLRKAEMIERNVENVLLSSEYLFRN